MSSSSSEPQVANNEQEVDIDVLSTASTETVEVQSSPTPPLRNSSPAPARTRPSFTPFTESQIKELHTQLETFLKAQPTEAKEEDNSLDIIITEIVATGNTSFSWDLLKAYLAIVLERAIQSFGEAYESVATVDGETFQLRLDRVQTNLAAFQEAPFTLQRMTELLAQPKRHYKSLSKFFLAFAKVSLLSFIYM